MVAMAGQTSGLRLGVLALVVVSLFAALFSRLWFLQVAAPPDLVQTVRSSHVKAVQVPAMRGRILDGKGRILADNRRVLNIVVDRKAIQKRVVRTELFGRLAGVIEVAPEDMEKKYKDKDLDPLLPLPLAHDVSEPQAAFLRERLDDFTGVQVEEAWDRVYRFAPLASNIIGFLGRINKDEIATLVDQKGYLRSDLVGRSGIEQQFEDVLRGKPGFQKYERDAAGQPIAQLQGPENRQDPTAGNDVQLTVDIEVQQYAEQILDAELRNRRLQRPPRSQNLITGDFIGDIKHPFAAPAGSLVVLEPTTGRVVAMASNPPYDNRWFSEPLTDEKFKQLFGDPKIKNAADDPTHFPLLNRPIQGLYQIGSTMKLFTSIASLQSGVISPEDRPKVENSHWLYEIPDCPPGEPSGCTRQNAGGAKYGRPNLLEALTASSDAYFYNLGAQLWQRDPTGDILQKELRSFGLGSASGIALPNEASGYVPDKALKKKFAENKVISKLEGGGYYIGDNINLAIGQGLLAVTPLQLANAYATFANGGNLLTPTIATHVYAAGGPRVEDQPYVLDTAKAETLQTFDPVSRGEVAVDDNFRADIMQGLQGVTQNCCVNSLDVGFPRPGTAYSTFKGYDYEAYPIFGKTGTAQDKDKIDWKDTSLFSAFGIPPGQTDPQYQVTAIIEQAGFGSGSAAPVVRCMFEKLATPGSFAPVKQSDELKRTQSKAAILPPLASADEAACLHVQDDDIRQAAIGKPKSGGRND